MIVIKDYNPIHFLFPTVQEYETFNFMLKTINCLDLNNMSKEHKFMYMDVVSNNFLK